LIDQVKDNVHMADFFLHCSPQQCDELFWKRYSVSVSIHYQINGVIFAETSRDGELR